jgi:hypothetical protein
MFHVKQDNREVLPVGISHNAPCARICLRTIHEWSVEWELGTHKVENYLALKIAHLFEAQASGWGILALAIISVTFFVARRRFR